MDMRDVTYGRDLNKAKTLASNGESFQFGNSRCHQVPDIVERERPARGLGYLLMRAASLNSRRIFSRDETLQRSRSAAR
jgi:hypothetical protein